MSKGSRRRPGNNEAFRANYDRIFGKREPGVRKPDRSMLRNAPKSHEIECKRRGD